MPIDMRLAFEILMALATVGICFVTNKVQLTNAIERIKELEKTVVTREVLELKLTNLEYKLDMVLSALQISTIVPAAKKTTKN